MNTAVLPAVHLGGAPVTTHDHLCLFFRGRGERDRILATFLQDGLRAGDTCLCLTADGETRDVEELVGRPDLDLRTLELVEPRDTYMQHGRFSPEAMLQLLGEWSTRTFVTQGRPFARVIGDMSWIGPFASPTFVADLLSYEARVTRWVQANPMISVCMYDVDLFDADVLLPLIKVHPKTWLQETVLDNPGYLKPEEHRTAVAYLAGPPAGRRR
jgi:hypothetical protein